MTGMMASALLLSAALVFGVANSFAQTGSRLGSTIQPLTTVWLAPPSEIAKVRSLLQEGQTEDAIDLARKFLSSLGAGASEGSGSHRYSALNALCVALMSDGQLEQAASNCDEATNIRPNHWRAINSSGTIHYLAERFEEAAATYRRALELEPDSGGVTSLLRHNLELAENRLPKS